MYVWRSALSEFGLFGVNNLVSFNALLANVCMFSVLVRGRHLFVKLCAVSLLLFIICVVLLLRTRL